MWLGMFAASEDIDQDKVDTATTSLPTSILGLEQQLLYLNKLRNTAKDLDNENDGKYI